MHHRYGDLSSYSYVNTFIQITRFWPTPILLVGAVKYVG